MTNTQPVNRVCIQLLCKLHRNVDKNCFEVGTFTLWMNQQSFTRRWCERNGGDQFWIVGDTGSFRCFSPSPVEDVFNTDEGDAVFEWQNITVSEATEIGRPPEPKINPEDTDDKDNNTGDGIGNPPDPKINPEDTDEKQDSEELASSEGKDLQGKSGLSILWIVLIIVGGIATVGTTTRAIQKNNS